MNSLKVDKKRSIAVEVMSKHALKKRKKKKKQDQGNRKRNTPGGISHR